MKKIFEILFIVLLVLFLSLYFSRFNNSYYESKTVMTDEAIKRFETDLKLGKNIKPSEYLPREKNYNNKISIITLKSSNLIGKTFRKLLKNVMKILNGMINA